VVARRAAAFEPSPTVWSIDRTTLVAAVPEPIVAEPASPPEADEFRSLFDEVGADAVVEAGVLRAEVLGLEVARIEVTDTGAHLAIGVGKHDRDAQREVHGSRPQGFDRLFEAVRVVAEHRVAGGGGHAAYQLAPERWLRAIVIRRPEVVGAASLHAVPSPVTRHDLRQSAPAPAAGVDASGAAVLVVCSVGVDLDLVPVAADARAADGRKPRLVLCVPVGDDHRVTREQAAALRTPADIVTVGQEWRAL
jgi:hypothetical protein